jgi:hypothetical protein
MKLATTALLVSVASANLFSLRSPARVDPENDIETRVMIQGISKELSAQDMEIVGKSLVKAYNDVLAEAGQTFDVFEPASTAKLQGWGCKHCKPDDDTLESTGAVVNGNLKGWGCKQ